MSKPVCKEQIKKCRCIVKERVINNQKKERVEKKDDCVEVYRDFGECLQKVLVSMNDKSGNQKQTDDCC